MTAMLNGVLTTLLVSPLKTVLNYYADHSTDE